MLGVNQRARGPNRPVFHNAVRSIAPISSLCTCLDHFVECLKAKTPVAAWRAEEPHIASQVRAEMMFGPLQPVVFIHGIESCAVLKLQVVDELDLVACVNINSPAPLPLTPLTLTLSPLKTRSGPTPQDFSLYLINLQKLFKALLHPMTRATDDLRQRPHHSWGMCTLRPFAS